MTATHTPPDHGLTEGQIAAHYARLERQETAAAAPLPGPLADAFSSLQTEIAGIRLRPLVARDLALLRDLDSPLLAQFREFTKPAAERAVTPYTDEQAWEMVYLLAVPSRHARATLAQGRPAFRQAAEDLLGDLPIVALNALVQQVALRLLESYSTAVSYAPQAKEGEQVFTRPAGPPATASAGGSTTSPASPSIADSPSITSSTTSPWPKAIV